MNDLRLNTKRQHKCQQCNKWACKALRHTEPRATRKSRSSAPSDEVSSLRQQLVVLSTRLNKFEAQCSENTLCSTPVVSSKQTSASPSRPPAPVTSDQPSASPPLFGLPAVTFPVSSVKPEAQLQNRNILWTSNTSAGERLPLPLHSCCSVSLVSKLHADFVASKPPDLKYCTLEGRISVTAAVPKSNLTAVATMEIPITWETITGTVFTMLVIPGLVWPILFVENHLYITQALVDHHVPAVTFRNTSSYMSIAPLTIHLKASLPNASLSHQSGQTASKAHVSVTRLPIVAPPPGVHNPCIVVLTLLQSATPFLQLLHLHLHHLALGKVPF